MADEADPPAHGPAVARQLAAQHARGAGVGAQERGQDPQQGRLAGAVRAEDDQRPPLFEGEGQVLQRDALAVRPAEAAALDRGHRRSVSAACLSVGATTGKSWSIAFGLPGKLMMSVRPAIPATPRVRMPRGVCVAPRRAHRLGESGRLALDHGAGGLGRDVVGGQTGPAGREDERQPRRHVRAQPLFDRRRVVGHDLRGHHVGAGPAGQPASRAPETSSPSPRDSVVEMVRIAVSIGGELTGPCASPPCRPSSPAAPPLPRSPRAPGP